ncbi:PilZ domain-containing protein [Aquipuribacter hungaricus]|uniref:PilZ domain-containing protein n=1 Tax=Aquipuribacter hungaricus TaxID=545624 RepID=A0ABV7WI11_9MICO
MSARTVGAAVTLPRLNTPVLVSVPGLGHDLPSRVEDLRGGYVLVSAVTPGRTARVADGELLTLAWAAPPRGLLAVSCVLEQQQGGAVPLWVLRPVGVLRRLQRRRFARADVSARVGLSGTGGPAGTPGTGTPGTPGPADQASPAGGWSASGVLADLGEGGARVLLDDGHRLPVGPGSSLVVDLRIAGEPLVTLATVVHVDPPGPGRQQVRLEFDLTERDADRVRRAVMQRQVEARTGEERS